MKILFDNGTPKPIARSLASHEITFARQIGWHELENGDLIQQAEEAGYEVLLSTDKNIHYQQNPTGRKIALVSFGNQQSRQPAMAARETAPRENRGRRECGNTRQLR